MIAVGGNIKPEEKMLPASAVIRESVCVSKRDVVRVERHAVARGAIQKTREMKRVCVRTRKTVADIVKRSADLEMSSPLQDATASIP
jgi:hypothetical protein